MCSNEPLAFVLRSLQWPRVAGLLGLAAGLALPSVILMAIFGQSRVAFAMSRDGLLPRRLCSVHKKYGTPSVVTGLTGLIVATCAALFPIGRLADLANTGTLFAFFTVIVGVVLLRRRDPHRPHGFRTPGLVLLAPAAAVGCLFLFSQLPLPAQGLFLTWACAGGVVYVTYGRRYSDMAGAHATLSGHSEEP